MQTFNLFIQSHNWSCQGLSFVRFLWKNQGARTHYIYHYGIFLFQLQSKLANMPSLRIFSPEPCPCTIISTNILCANAVIDTFITSKGIQFSFQSSTGMNSATSSVANNRDHYCELKDAFAFSMYSRGKYVKLFANICSQQMETAFQQVSIQFYCQTNIIFVWDCGNHWADTDVPLLFILITLMSLTECQVQT